MKWLRRTLIGILALGALAAAAVAGVLWLLGTEGGAARYHLDIRT